MAAMAAMAAMAGWPDGRLVTSTAIMPHAVNFFAKAAMWPHGCMASLSPLFHRFTLKKSRTLKKAAIRPRIVNFFKKVAMAAMAGWPLGYPLIYLIR